MRRTFVTFASVLAISPVVLSCGATKQLGDLLAPYTPKLHFERVAVDKIDFTSISADFVFAVQNPNPISVKLDQFGYSLGLEGVEFLKGRNTDGIQLKSKGDTELSIPVSLAFADIFKLVQNVDGKDDIAFSLAGDFGFNTPVGMATVPFREEGRFPIVRPPTISLKGAKLGEMSVLKGKAVLNVELGFKNDKGGAPVSFKGFDYGVKVAGVAVSTGVLENVPDAPAGQEQVVTLPINLDLLKLGKTLVTALQSKKPVDVGLDAKVTVGTPFGPIPFDVAQAAAFMLK